jgi:hypothetical protein
MSTDGDDQCVHCGGNRGEKSVLDIDCLETAYKISLIRRMASDLKIKKLEREKKALSELVERLIDHISSEAVYTSELRLELWKTKGIIKGG